MPFKRLRTGKTMQSENVLFLSKQVKESQSKAVHTQFAELMKLPAEYSDTAESIRSCGYTVLRSVRNMNEYCAAVAGSYSLNPQKTELCLFMSMLLKNTVPFAEKAGALLYSKIPEEKIYVKTDKEKLAYAVLDIILNSCDNIFPEGKIKLSVAKTKKFAKITVSDNGRGMDEEAVLHCCEPFYSEKTVANKKGMGLGLTLALHFIEKSGGRIKISSEKGKGTSVSVFLPLMSAEEERLYVESPVQEVFGGIFSPIYITFAGNDI